LRTLGIDLAASPDKTGLCEIEWGAASAKVVSLDLGADDDALLEVARASQIIAVDCPLGWPDPFVSALQAHHRGDDWPGRGAIDPDQFRRTLSLRATDEHTRDTIGLQPLSVSANFLGVTAMRCALICDRLAMEGADVRRDGRGKIAEVYPAAALKRWGLPHGRYKSKDGAPVVRELILARLTSAAPWLELSPADAARCAKKHDLIDALICALVARAVSVDLTEHAPARLAARALREGWIHVPAAGSLGGLATA
jgi:predicted nuclease with RNAse H fold